MIFLAVSKVFVEQQTKLFSYFLHMSLVLEVFTLKVLEVVTLVSGILQIWTENSFDAVN